MKPEIQAADYLTAVQNRDTMNQPPTSFSLNHRTITVSRAWRQFTRCSLLILVGIVAGFLDPLGILFPPRDILLADEE